MITRVQIQVLKLDPEKDILVVSIPDESTIDYMDSVKDGIQKSLTDFNMPSLNGLNMLFKTDCIKLSKMSIGEYECLDTPLLGRKLRIGGK